jgi:hypothetical protein
MLLSGAVLLGGVVTLGFMRFSGLGFGALWAWPGVEPKPNPAA